MVIMVDEMYRCLNLRSAVLLADGGRAGERPGRRRGRRVVGAGAAEGNGDETVERKAKGFEMGYIVFVVVS